MGSVKPCGPRSKGYCGKQLKVLYPKKFHLQLSTQGSYLHVVCAFCDLDYLTTENRRFSKFGANLDIYWHFES